jgi:hypothetical protein
VVALNAPERRPESNFDEIRQYSQRRADYIDLDANHLVSGYFSDVLGQTRELPVDWLTSPDTSQRLPDGSRPLILTFDRLLGKTEFVRNLRDVLGTLEDAYGCPVDIEFTCNFTNDRDLKINLVQCRPLQVRGTEAVELPTIEVAEEDRLIEARSAVIGQSRTVPVDTFVYVVPAVYGKLPVQPRYEVARLLGQVNRALNRDGHETIMLIGPGRWGTSSPSLGIPVAFSDINRVTILCEVVTMRQDLVPDVSLGTHFLSELVEMDMLYLALFPNQGNNRLRESFFEESPSVLPDLVPGADKWFDCVKVIRSADVVKEGSEIRLVADAVEQKVICFFNRQANENARSTA